MIIFFVIVLIAVMIINPDKTEHKVAEVISPVNIVLDNGEHYKINDLVSFDSSYSGKNKELSQKFGMNEDEAFIFGNLAKYWAENLVLHRNVRINNDDLIYYKFDYKTKFNNSAFCIKDAKACNQTAYQRLLDSIRKSNFVIVDTDKDVVYPVSKANACILKNYVVVRKSHVKKLNKESKYKEGKSNKTVIKSGFQSVLDLGNVKIIVSDLTSKLVPDRNCSSSVCKAILSNINQTKETLDIAIYGYSSVPQIEKAIESAQKRGVKVRLVYDLNINGENIYPDTSKIIKLIPANTSDKLSKEPGNTMHNKFYIFDNKVVITGSANLSHTDMSGYNSNSIIIIKLPEVAKIYSAEFEQMYNKKFHNEKISVANKRAGDIEVFFSPQDKAITNGVLPIIRNSEKYIYIPAFIITEKRMADELINAHNRGVDVKVIVDSLNASNSYSKHRYLRNAGIPVKAENYAGKMHSKTIISDDKYLIIGSMNFSKSGENKNDENMIIFKNSQASDFYKRFFLYQWERIPDYWLKHVPRAEGKDSIGSCADGIDNNYDGYTDRDDPACKK